jgi:cbb3-type cytochrome oxidase subunit 3
MTDQANVLGSPKGITKSFGGNKALNGFNFKIYTGINGSIGPNGAEKTPTIKHGLIKAVPKPVLAVLCTLLCLLPLFFSSPAIGQTNNSFPSTFHVTFQGHMTPSEPNPDGIAPTLWVQLLNGTNYYPETAHFTFFMEESLEGEYTAKFMLTFDNFSKEVSLPATVSNGRVYIDSIPTIFVVDPASLVDGKTIQLFQTENMTLSGAVLEDGRPTTLINNYRVASKVVRATYQQTNSSNLLSLGSTLLFFDPKTGVLTQAPSKFSDVLLNKLGVESIVGGIFELSDYSENLNFALVTMPSEPAEPSELVLFILTPVFVIVFILVGFFAYRSLKKKRAKRKTTQIILQKSTLHQNIL